MNYKYISSLSIFFLLCAFSTQTQAEISLGEKLAGKILLQVNKNGEAWYVNPTDRMRYNLGRPENAFEVMRLLGKGISNQDLEKFPLGFNEYDDLDSDNDNLSDRFETALGTDPNKSDTDNDGFSDYEELKSNYNPKGSGELNIDQNFAKKHAGKIFLQVESAGEAWYINPSNNHRYYLGRPIDAFLIMKSLGLGITDNDISQIYIKYYETQDNSNNTSSNKLTYKQVMTEAPNAIRSSNPESALKYFTEDSQAVVKYTLNFLDQSGRLTLANILSGASKTSETTNEVIYTAEVFFQDDKIKVDFRLEKQPNGSYLLANL